MERVYVGDTEDAVWTEEALLSLHERPALKRNHVLFPVVLGIVIVFALATSLWYGFDRPEAVGKLLAARSCEGCNFSRVNLSGASLSGVKLSRAILKGADLSVANFSHADLRNADLSGASLYRANLSGADLRGAAVTGAHLLFTNLSGAIWVDGRPLVK
ncbi:MAG: pentapeptide repeat-containing protein [Syntrophorhabdales bacterium]|jgi:hypothetical protein